MTPAATGTDTAGSLRIPSACSGTSAMKPTRGLVSLAGVVPLAWSLDHAGPMARSLADCAMLLEAMAGPDRAPRRELAARARRDVVAPAGRSRARASPSRRASAPRSWTRTSRPGFDRALDACRRLGAELVEPPAPGLPDAVGEDFVDVLTTEMLVYHRRFDAHRGDYRPSLREWVETGERRAMSAEDYVAAQRRRLEACGAWAGWLAEHRIDALLEPTIPVVAPLRGDGYDHAGTDYALISLTHLWDWTGFPVAALPAGVGSAGLPVGVSLIGPAGSGLGPARARRRPAERARRPRAARARGVARPELRQRLC